MPLPLIPDSDENQTPHLLYVLALTAPVTKQVPSCPILFGTLYSMPGIVHGFGLCGVPQIALMVHVGVSLIQGQPRVYPSYLSVLSFHTPRAFCIGFFGPGATCTGSQLS